MDGRALIYCEGAFGTPNGKTANGLVRHTARYKVLGIIDSARAGRDAGVILDGAACGIPIFADLAQALDQLSDRPEFFVIGLAPDGGQLPPNARKDVALAIERGLNVDSGLHEFLSEDPEFAALAERHKVRIRDVRRPPRRRELHFFTGEIEEVTSVRIAVLGSDSAVGKRTTAVQLTLALNDAGIKTEMIGTGQTSWMQGVKYGILLDSLINDFVTGEIEHVIHKAFVSEHPSVIVLEGQGCIAHPAYPGGFELLAAGRPDGIVLQHAPKRACYDGFPKYPVNPLEREIQILELLSQKPVIAITLNHEGMTTREVDETIAEYETRFKLPVTDTLLYGSEKLVRTITRLYGDRLGTSAKL